MSQLETQPGYCRVPGYDTYRGVWSENFWSTTLNTKDNPTLILVQVLKQRGLDVQIVDSDTSEGDVEIHASPEGEAALDRISRTIELRDLSKAIWWGACRDLSRIAPDGIRPLIEEVVDRELAQ